MRSLFRAFNGLFQTPSVHRGGVWPWGPALLLVGLALGLVMGLSVKTPVAAESDPAQFLKTNSPVLVEFYSPYCGACQILAPYIDQIEDETRGQGRVVRMNVVMPKYASLAEKFQIHGTPTYMVYNRQGTQTYRSGPYLDENVVRKEFWRAIGKPVPSTKLKKMPPKQLK